MIDCDCGFRLEVDHTCLPTDPRGNKMTKTVVDKAAKKVGTNKAAITALKASPVTLTEEHSVAILIEAGLLEADDPSEPEQYAQAAYEWIEENNCITDQKAAFERASSWSTSSWGRLVNKSLEYDEARKKNIFAALVIMAKNAGVEL